MILSNVAIHQAMDDGVLSIDPEPLPRFNSLADQTSPYDTSSVNLRLSADLNIADEKKPYAFDLRTSGGLPSFLRGAYRSHKIDPQGGFILNPNVFVLGSTVEVVSLRMLPAKRVLAARVEGRSSFARCGLLVHFTAPTIKAGFSGTITLEILNLGTQAIVLYPGMPICQLIFEVVDGMPLNAAESRFQGQRTPAGTST
jgi:dCTP deaminase